MDNFELLSNKIADVLSKEKIVNLKKSFNAISEKYRKERGDSETVVSNNDEVLTYISSRMIETSAIVDDVLSKIDSITDFKSEVFKIIDVGSGTGACLWAIENYFKRAKVIAIEKETAMIKYSKLLCESLSCYIDYLEESIFSKKINDIENSDLVIESFMLNELTDKERLKATQTMCDKTDDFLVLIEPGTPKSYERMMEVRNYVLSKGFNLILPCSHSGVCGLKNDYCNFSVRVSRTNVNRQVKNAALNYEDEKYFYLVFRKNKKREDVNKFVVLRKPIYRKGCVDLKLCALDGNIKNETITKSNINYKKARKLKHGDIVDFNVKE